MKDPLNPLYRTMNVIEDRPAGFILSGQFLALILIVVWIVIASIAVRLFPSLDLGSVMLWGTGISVVVYFSYSFIRNFFNATTANSEATARAGDEKYG